MSPSASTRVRPGSTTWVTPTVRGLPERSGSGMRPSSPATREVRMGAHDGDMRGRRIPGELSAVLEPRLRTRSHSGRVGLSTVRPRHVYAAAAAAFVLLAGFEGARMAAGRDPALARTPTSTQPPVPDGPYGGQGGSGTPDDGDGLGDHHRLRGGPPDDAGGQAEDGGIPGSGAQADGGGQARPLETHQS